MAKISLEISDERVNDLLTSAVEGGIAYWGRLSFHDGLWRVKLRDEPERGYLPFGPDTIRLGLERASRHPNPGIRRHLGNWLAECDDAETADVILQLGLFDDVVYG